MTPLNPSSHFSPLDVPTSDSTALRQGITRLKPLIVNCMYGESSDRRDDRWFAPKLGEEAFEWKFFRVVASKLQQRLKLPHVQRRLVPWQCAQFIKRHAPDLLVTHDYSLSHYCARACARANAAINHIAFSFNLPQLPSGTQLEPTFRPLKCHTKSKNTCDR